MLSLSSYVLQLHIEQGPVLEAHGLPLGVVEAIAGQTRLTVCLWDFRNIFEMKRLVEDFGWFKMAEEDDRIREVNFLTPVPLTILR